MDSFEIKVTLPVTSEVLYSGWLDSEIHSDFTGAMAAIEAKINTFFTAWDGYITGRILELEENRRIQMSWRTTEFDIEADSSLVVLYFNDAGDSCDLTLIHTLIPGGDGDKYKKGWQEFYFTPMMEYFNSK